MSKIVQLTAENVKRLKAVNIAPDGSLVVIGGRNAQGKSSVLDAIAMALGGKDEVPARPVREGADRARIILETEDLVITRTFTAAGGTTLKVEAKDEVGGKQSSPQTILDKLTGKLTFDPLAFTRLDPKKQADALRRLVGLDFTAHDAERKRVYDERTELNRDTEKLRAKVGAMPLHPDSVPDEEVTAADLLKKLSDASETNAKAARRDTLRAQANEAVEQAARLRRQADELDRKAKELLVEAEACPQSVDVTALTKELADINDTNRKVREKKERKKLVTEGKAMVAVAERLTKELADLDATKKAALESAPFPVPGLGFGDEGVTYNGVPFSQASAAEQMRISVAMAAALNPSLKVMLVRDGSLLDADSLAELGRLAESHGLQVWIERVGTGQEVSVVIEDGEVVAA